MAIFNLLTKETISKVDRERVKQASRSLLEAVQNLIAPLERWTEKEQTQAEVEVLILNHVFKSLPTPPFSITMAMIVVIAFAFSAVKSGRIGFGTHSSGAGISARFRSWFGARGRIASPSVASAWPRW